MRARRLPTVSMSQAVLSTSRRAISSSMRLSAIQSRMFALLRDRPAEGLALVGAVAHQLERALRRADRPHAVVDAARSQPGLRDREAHRPRRPRMFSTGTRTSSKRSTPCPSGSM